MSDEEIKENKTMEESEEELYLREVEQQSFSCMSKRRKLHDFKEKVVVVEFECSVFIKKAYGCLKSVGCDYLELVRTKEHPVTVNIFSSSRNLEPEYAYKIIIPLEKVCSVELKSYCSPYDDKKD